MRQVGAKEGRARCRTPSPSILPVAVAPRAVADGERGRQIFEQRVEYPLPKETGVEGFISIETADAENLFWGRRSAVWNNNGDKAVLRDENGADVARYAY